VSGTAGGGRKFVKENGSLPPELLNLLLVLLLWKGSVVGELAEKAAVKLLPKGSLESWVLPLLTAFTPVKGSLAKGSLGIREEFSYEVSSVPNAEAKGSLLGFSPLSLLKGSTPLLLEKGSTLLPKASMESL
jgi:hypothetical protein